MGPLSRGAELLPRVSVFLGLTQVLFTIAHTSESREVSYEWSPRSQGWPGEAAGNFWTRSMAAYIPLREMARIRDDPAAVLTERRPRQCSKIDCCRFA